MDDTQRQEFRKSLTVKQREELANEIFSVLDEEIQNEISWFIRGFFLCRTRPSLDMDRLDRIDAYFDCLNMQKKYSEEEE
tara:strand:+ start:130 stop:369 length:240 start_codon:yes stop_codon:yes gene_type:complete